MKYLPATDISEEAVRELMAEREMDLTQSDMVTYAVAFGQIKVTGKVDRELKGLALNAIRRFNMAIGEGPSQIADMMVADLERVDIYS